MFALNKTDLSKLNPTSKVTLKLSCLAACNNDVVKAAELYDFIAKDLELPDFDPVAPTTMERIKEGANDVFGWIGEHRSEIVEGVQFARSMFARSGGEAASSLAGVPPIPKL